MESLAQPGWQLARAVRPAAPAPSRCFRAGFGAPMSPCEVGGNVVSILTDPRHATGVAFGIDGDLGIVSLDA
jgi:hypothetical protein